jgi:anthranilate phosphoribosyltransferase
VNIKNETIIEQLINGIDLDAITARELMKRILSGAMPPAQVAASLVLLRAKKESATEIAETASFIISEATFIERPNYLFADVVGTGGDGYNTINISTMASLTAASYGLPVAKHGNTSISSRCGSADLLNELGINISLNPKQARKSLDENQWCFLFAPLYHLAFKSIKSLRQELGVKTLFNLIGPLVNPMSPPVMLLGVYDPNLIQPFASALKGLGCKRALIVHGSGLDEIALHGPTTAALLDDTKIENMTITVNELGLKSYGLEEIIGHGVKENTQTCVDILSGRASEAKLSMVALSAGALLWLGGKAGTLKQGVKISLDSLQAGVPAQKLKNIKEAFYGS